MTTLILYLLPFAFWFAQASPQAFTVAGKLVDAASRAPLAKARLALTPVETAMPEPGVVRQRPQPRIAITGADGAFGFLNVPQGRFQLSAALPGRSPQLYLGDDRQYSTAIVTGPDIDAAHLVFPLHSGGSISGTVIDENGEPVRPQVHLYRKAVVDGRERVMQAGATGQTTNGSFHFGHLLPGSYYIAVTAQPWYVNNSAAMVNQNSVMQARPEFNLAYPLTYYPGTPDFASASAIVVTDGSAASVQVTLRAVPGVHVTAPVAGLPGQDLTMRPSMIASVGPDGNLFMQQSIYGNTGSAGVAPGTYEILFGGMGPQGLVMDRRQIVHVAGDMQIEFPPPASIAVNGTVKIDGPTKPGNCLFVALSQNERSSHQTVIEDNGSFTFPREQLSAGSYEITFPSNPLFFVKQISATGAPFKNGLLELQDGSSVQLNIVLSEASKATLEGVAVANDHPYAGAMVLLILNGGDGLRAILRDQSDLDGSFTFRGVPPGNYQLVAIDNGHDFVYREANVIRPYLAKARAIRVGAGGDVAAKSDLKVEVQHRGE